MSQQTAPQRPLRILVGTFEVAGMLPDFADGFRQLGHQVTSAIAVRNRFYPDFHYDVDIGPNAGELPLPDWMRRSRSAWVRVPRGLTERLNRQRLLFGLIRRHDVFFFQWAGMSLTEGSREFGLLRRLDKKIITMFCGSDVRSIPAYAEEFASVATTPEWRSELMGRMNSDEFKPLRNMRRAELYSDAIYSLPNQSSLAVRPYDHAFLPIDLSKYEFRIHDRAIPVIVHAPSSKAIKGTAEILGALERLRRDGIEFELDLLQDVPNEEVKAHLSNADVVIDQLFFPLHGKLGIEAMASGCALATGNRQDLEPFPADRPIWHIDLSNIDAQLRRLLTDRDLRRKLAAEGRQYVERYHSHVAVTRRMLSRLTPAVQPERDHYPTFFTRRFQRAAGIEIPLEIQAMTARIIRRWGLPRDVDPQGLVARGLVAGNRLGRTQRIPIWSISGVQ